MVVLCSALDLPQARQKGRERFIPSETASAVLNTRQRPLLKDFSHPKFRKRCGDCKTKHIFVWCKQSLQNCVGIKSSGHCIGLTHLEKDLIRTASREVGRTIFVLDPVDTTAPAPPAASLTHSLRCVVGCVCAAAIFTHMCVRTFAGCLCYRHDEAHLDPLSSFAPLICSCRIFPLKF